MTTNEKALEATVQAWHTIRALRIQRTLRVDEDRLDAALKKVDEAIRLIGSV